MNQNELTHPHTEDQIPLLAAIAVERAYRDALAAGQHVLIADSGVLVEVSPDGTRRELKLLEPHVPVTQGQVIAIQ